MEAPLKTLISEEEYLSECYEPDCDYVDGQLEERNLGERDHAWLQTLVAGYFLARRKQWDVMPLVELRVQVKPKRYRVPDVCVVLGHTDEQILTKPPFICIEVLSPDDRMSRVKKRLQDFLDMGVPYVWILDPQTKSAYAMTVADGLCKVKGGVLRTENPAFEVPLADLFE
jgi:Uma2 family endonuclease